MLKNRIIPILLLKHGRCVKGKQFSNYRDTGNPITAARVYDAQRVDELVFLDILASKEERALLLDIVTETAEQCFMPLTIGGGLKTIEDIQEVLAAGADKISINTAAAENPQFIKNASSYYGSANIIVSIDYKINSNNEREVYTHGGSNPTGLNALDWAKEVERLGAGEIILTSIDKEGFMQGYDIDFVRQVCDSLNIPVIIHGGAGKMEDFKLGIDVAKASGAAAASIFHFTEQSPIKTRYFLNVHGVNVRK